MSKSGCVAWKVPADTSETIAILEDSVNHDVGEVRSDKQRVDSTRELHPAQSVRNAKSWCETPSRQACHSSSAATNSRSEISTRGNVDFVKTRAPFTADPSKQDLWCIYRQRAVLITG
ncbi:hypothetical protein AYL99_11999 [Fonsecaea erecta]|uniref:Uncharacterized protein n=1 Tax=Fonsecaea erecta TaxID=1367422 RepID=A0A178Z3M7_9EURO|nr:hypothetical protein AYL99_11999 [Fonsecaea erecta]OAP53813.1 hypothetical protein AYL99_11999 [Fonsecaea erecta]